jgi:hypothetical protein
MDNKKRAFYWHQLKQKLLNGCRFLNQYIITFIRKHKYNKYLTLT